MTVQHYADHSQRRSPEASRPAKAKETPHHEAHVKEAQAKEQASRSVMHPESFDPEWRYYHGAWGG